ncbi:MAG TPA: hypothetical protein GX700_03005 [Paracoccus sp.]|nr:hypothetical protein [Paracoccus sp. (in: a-proteobacteria)]
MAVRTSRYEDISTFLVEICAAGLRDAISAPDASPTSSESTFAQGMPKVHSEAMASNADAISVLMICFICSLSRLWVALLRARNDLEEAVQVIQCRIRSAPSAHRCCITLTPKCHRFSVIHAHGFPFLFDFSSCHQAFNANPRRFRRRPAFAAPLNGRTHPGDLILKEKGKSRPRPE